MSIRPLRYLGDPILRTASDPVTRFDKALAVLIEDLLDTVRKPGRAGLGQHAGGLQQVGGGHLQILVLGQRLLHQAVERRIVRARRAVEKAISVLSAGGGALLDDGA